MGQHADDLGAALGAEVGSLHDDTDQLGLIGDAVSSYAQSLRSMATDLGLGGTTADLAGDSFAQLATAIVTTADRFDGVARSAATARAAILQAREDYRALPDGELSLGERAALAAGGTIAMPGVGTVAAIVAGGIWSDQREAEREKAARKAIETLNASLAAAGDSFPPATHLPEGPDDGDTEEHGDDGARGSSAPVSGVPSLGGSAPSSPAGGPGTPTWGATPVLPPAHGGPTTPVHHAADPTPAPHEPPVVPPGTGHDTTPDGGLDGTVPGTDPGAWPGGTGSHGTGIGAG
ncbi:hypothetical protein AB5970_16695, partial [Cellulomonas sp. ICMP 17802]